MPKKDNANKIFFTNPMENPLVLDVYRHQANYRIETDEDAKGDLCAVYFSSNGIYSENTEEEFTRVILEKDRFEWSRNRVQAAKKHVFLRDVTKNMYQNGISETMNSLEKMIDFLREETKGYRLVTVGSSSGGYCACAAGVMLNAERVYSFTGQFSVYISFFQVPYGPVDVFDLSDEALYPPEKVKYYNIIDHMKCCNVPIFYFSSLQKQDLVQLHLAKQQFNIFTFAMKSKEHRRPVYGFNFNDIINMDDNVLKRLGEKYSDRKISRFWFSVQVTGFWQTVRLLLKQFYNQTRTNLFD